MKRGASPSQCRQTRMLKLSQASPNVAARSQVVGPRKATLVYLGRLSALWWLRESAFLISQGISDKGLGVAPTSTGSVPYPCEPGRICGMQLTEPENARCRGFMHAQPAIIHAEGKFNASQCVAAKSRSRWPPPNRSCRRTKQRVPPRPNHVGSLERKTGRGCVTLDKFMVEDGGCRQTSPLASCPSVCARQVWKFELVCCWGRARVAAIICA